MKSVNEISARIQYFEQRLVKIQEGVDNQLALPFFERSEHVCRFLDVERRINSLVIHELKWILDEK